MNKLPLLLAFALGAVLGAVAIGSVSSRWYFTAGPSGLIFRGDKWTGEAWYALVRDRVWVRIRNELSDTDVFGGVAAFDSTEATPDALQSVNGEKPVRLELNTDFSTKGLSAPEITAIVSAWQANALSRDSMIELFRRGEVLPEGRTNEEEEKLIGENGKPESAVAIQ